MIGLSGCSRSCQLIPLHWGTRSTFGSLLRTLTRSPARSLAWSPMLLCDVGAQKLAISASYPKLIMRASEILSFKRSFGQQTLPFVQVFSRSPRRPCTKTILSLYQPSTLSVQYTKEHDYDGLTPFLRPEGRGTVLPCLCFSP